MQETLNPAERLVGLELEEGWTVVRQLATGRRDAGGQGTGGHFSVSYLVQKGERVAFLKAIDMVPALKNAPNMMARLQSLVDEYQFEKSLHDLCRDKRMGRVVRILGSGQVEVPKVVGDTHNIVPYLITELADYGDIRRCIAEANLIEDSHKLSHLRDVMTGLKQLHQASVAHQDLKPSNVMIFSNGGGAKIGDLGRAVWQGRKSWHDEGIAGDRGYAPPEQLYGYHPPEWIDQRARCDLYQFGSLLTFLFSGQTLNSYIQMHLDHNVKPSVWGGMGNTYENALPFWQAAFSKVLLELEERLFPQWAAKRLSALVAQCSNPDFRKRGARKVIDKSPTQLGLDRFVSELDLLSKQAIVHFNSQRAKAA